MTVAVPAAAERFTCSADELEGSRSRCRLAATIRCGVEKMLINRVAISLAGVTLLFLALRRMEHREKLLS